MKAQRMMGSMLALLVMSLGVQAADMPTGKTGQSAGWPCWRGPDGSGVGVGCGQPLVDDMADMKLAWQSEERGIPANCWHNGTQGGYDSPIVANGKVIVGYFKGAGEILDQAILKDKDSKKAGAEKARWNAAVATEDIVLCADAQTGKTLWKKVLGEGINLYQRRKSGPHNPPCWHNGKVYAQSTMGRVYCLDESDGRVVWQSDIAATEHQIKVLAAYKKAGKQHPYRGIEPPELKEAGMPYLFMLPLNVADGVVVADSGVFEAATGKPVPWPKPPRGQPRSGSVAPLRWVCDGQEYFILGNACIRPKTGETVWQIKEAAGGTPALGGAYIVLQDGKEGFCCFRIGADGYKPVWKNTDYFRCGHMPCTGVIDDGWFFSEVNVAGGRANMPPGISEMAIGIELATGKVVGPVGFRGGQQTLVTSPTGMDGRWFFFVGAGNSGLVMMNLDPANFKQVGLRMTTVVGSVKSEETKAKFKLDFCNTSTPALANGFMYFRGSDCLWCYDVRKQ